jgi:hypothetical protein
MMKRYKPLFHETHEHWIDIKFSDIEKLEEGLRLSDLKKHSGLSALTTKWMKDRKRLKGAGNKSAKLKQLRVSFKNDYITYIFTSEPTYDKVVKVLKPKAMKPVRGTIYQQQIRIKDFFKLAATKPNFQKYHELTQQELKEVLSVADLQVYCNDMSWWWQGMAWVLTKFDASIYPCDIEPKVWSHKHNDFNFLCKHLSLLINSIDFWLNPMTSMINRYIKQKGI